jgi:DNA-binding protein YbaB
MFEKLKQLHKLKKQMEAMEVTEELNGVTIKMDGSFKVLEITIADKTDRKLEKNLRKTFNNAAQAIQRKMAKDMMADGGSLF